MYPFLPPILQNALRIILNEPAANGDSTSQQRLLMALEQKHKMSLSSLASSVSARILKQRQQSPQLAQFQDLYTLPICTVGDTQFVVRGRINRLEVQQESTPSTPNGDVSVAAGTELVLTETKQRLHKLFNALRSYEEIQVSFRLGEY